MPVAAPQGKVYATLPEIARDLGIDPRAAGSFHMSDAEIHHFMMRLAITMRVYTSRVPQMAEYPLETAVNFMRIGVAECDIPEHDKRAMMAVLLPYVANTYAAEIIHNPR